MATLASLTSQALDTVQKRDFSPSSPADTANVLLANLVNSTSGTSSSGVGSAAPVIRVTGTQTEGTITTGGTAQPAVSANPAANAFAIQNTHDTATLYVSLDGTVATTASFALLPGMTLNAKELGVMPTGEISIRGETTGQTFCIFTA